MKHKRNLFDSTSTRYIFFKGIYLKASSTYYLCDFYSQIDEQGAEIFKVLVQAAQLRDIELLFSFDAADNKWICQNTHTQPEELVEKIREQFILNGSKYAKRQ